MEQKKKSCCIFLQVQGSNFFQDVKQFSQTHEELQMLVYGFRTLQAGDITQKLLLHSYPFKQVMIIEAQLHDTTPSYFTKEL